MPNDDFSLELAQKFWYEFSNKQLAAGKKLRSAALTASEITLNKSVINYTLPSQQLMIQFLGIMPMLLQFLKEKLNNYSLIIEATVEESVQKKYAYSAQEKYELMVSTNKAIEVLRETFKLEL